MKQKSAIEWLVEKTFSDFGKSVKSQEIKMAMQMEKQQIIDAHSYGQYYCNGCDETSAEKYYNETYDIKGNDSTLNSTPNSTLNRFYKTEISDDEIERIGESYRIFYNGKEGIGNLVYKHYIQGIKWYREQLKKKQ